MSQKIQFKRTFCQDVVPDSDIMDFGEIYINYASGDGKSFLATKKSNGDVAQFMEKGYLDSKYTTKEETSELRNDAIFNVGDDYNMHYLLGINETGTTLNQSSLHYQSAVYMTNNTIYSTSDETLKDFGNDIVCDLDKLADIPKKYFTWKNDENKIVQIGTSAQKLMELYPEIVTKDKNGKLGVSYERLSLVALAAVDKLYEEILLMKKLLKDNYNISLE